MRLTAQCSGDGQWETCPRPSWSLLFVGQKEYAAGGTVGGGTQRILVCLGCHKKIPETRWLKQQTLSSPSSGGWEGQGQGVGRFASWWEPECLVSGKSLLPGLQTAAFLLRPHMAERALWWLSPFFLFSVYLGCCGSSLLLGLSLGASGVTV